VIRASELAGKPVRRENGEALGHVFEIRIKDSRITALICGSRGFFQRLMGSISGRRVDWTDVQRVTASEIVIAAAPARKLRRHRTRRRPSTRTKRKAKIQELRP